MSELNQHRRVNDILLGPLERPALKWLAAHMPAWVTPDKCTIIGVFGALVIAVSYTLSLYDRNFLWLASFGFFVHWFGDSLDGTLARYRGVERPIFGFFVDHTTDTFSATVILLSLGNTPYVSFNIACLTLIAYLLLCVLVFIRTGIAGEFKISYSKLGPTEFRAFAILLNTAMYFGGTQIFLLRFEVIDPITLTPYDIMIALIGLLLLSFFIMTALRETVRLAKENK
jgi:archaetidylinositol phosphate synthase